MAEEVRGRIPNPRFVYYGKDVWEAAAAACCAGENLLLAGPKATGKNVLAENLPPCSAARVWDISMPHQCGRGVPHRHRYAEGGRGLLPGRPRVPVRAAGRFRILDEVNMAKNEALAVLHATLDFRRGH